MQRVGAEHILGGRSPRGTWAGSAVEAGCLGDRTQAQMRVGGDRVGGGGWGEFFFERVSPLGEMGGTAVSRE